MLDHFFGTCSTAASTAASTFSTMSDSGWPDRATWGLRGGLSEWRGPPLDFFLEKKLPLEISRGGGDPLRFPALMLRQLPPERKR